MNQELDRLPERLWQLARPDYQRSFDEEQARYGSRQIAIGVRLRNDKVVYVLVNEQGSILAQVIGGQAGVTTEYEFDGSDIVAIVGRRKKRTGWLPWQFRYEDYDAYRVER